MNAWTRVRAGMGRRRWLVTAVAVAVLGAAGCQPVQWAAAPQGVAVANADGRLEFFRGTDETGATGVLYASQVTPNGPWQSGALPATPFSTTRIEVARNADGRLEVFASGSDLKMWHSWQDGSAEGWSPWSNLAGVGYVPTFDAARNADGRLEVFAIEYFDYDGFGRPNKERVVHAWQTTPGGGWSAWVPMREETYPASADLVAAQNDDGRLEVFTSGTTPKHAWQAPTGGWSGWVPLPMSAAGSIAVAPNADGRLEVFGTDGNQIVHAWQTAPNGGWSGGRLAAVPVPTPGFSPAMLAAPNADGRVEVFFTVGGDAGVPGHRVPGHIWQLSPNAQAGWSQPTVYPPLPFTYIGLPIVTGVGANADGRLELSVAMLENSLFSSLFTVHTYELAPNGGWSDWEKRTA